MTSKNHFGFLSTIDSPLLSYYLHSALKYGVSEIVVFCDSITITEKDWGIWAERTGEYFSESERSIFTLSASKIPFYFIDHNSRDFIAILRDLGVTCLLNAGTPRKITGDIISRVRDGVINIHPGVLPRYRGCTAVEWAIYNDEPVGNTAHLMSDKYDEGPIIEVETYSFKNSSSYIDIRTTVHEKGCDLAGKILKKVRDSSGGILETKTQDEKLAKYWKPIPEDKMNEVLRKTSLGKYKYQNIN